jgi:hypothetical protein
VTGARGPRGRQRLSSQNASRGAKFSCETHNAVPPDAAWSHMPCMHSSSVMQGEPSAYLGTQIPAEHRRSAPQGIVSLHGSFIAPLMSQ